ncbi:MAG: ParB/RepB/Spo0J family partition protein [Breznakia sp.]
MNNPKLGKGLSAIFGDDVDSILEDIQQGKVEGYKESIRIPLRDIKANPYQPRLEFDKEKLQELAQSIATHGVFTPILVKASVKGYVLIAGERRLRASKLAKLEEIPAIVVDFDDQQMMEISLLENIQRENLNVMEEANALAKMIDKLGYTQEALAKQIGKSREYVANTLRLLKLPKAIQTYVISNQLSMGHVRALLSLSSEADMVVLAKQAIKEKLSVRSVEKKVKDAGGSIGKKQKPKVIDKSIYAAVEKTLQQKLQTKVQVYDTAINISFNGNDDLNRILEIMGCMEEE